MATKETGIKIEFSVTAVLFIFVGVTLLFAIVFAMTNGATFRNSDAAGNKVGNRNVAGFVFGDCNLDGVIDAGDLSALNLEINDQDGNYSVDAFKGKYKGDITCDANYDSVVNEIDKTCLRKKILGSVHECEELAAPFSTFGDCNGDGVLNNEDITAIDSEIKDNDSTHRQLAHNSDFKGYQGCDANNDIVITKDDIYCAEQIISGDTSCIKNFQ